MELQLIAATTPSGCIGNQGRIPWRIREDLTRFKVITSTTETKDERNVVIMGRKTYQSIPKKKRPLEDRTNIVVTSQPEKIEEIDSPRTNLIFASSLEDAIKEAESLQKRRKVFVAGGVRLYREVIADKRCKRLYLTVVRRPVQCDSVVPEFCKVLEGGDTSPYKLVRSHNSKEDVEYRIYERENVV